MAMSAEFDALRATLDALRGHGVIPGVAERLGAGRERFTAELGSTVTGEVSAYKESGNPEVIPELEAHLDEAIEQACRLLAGDRIRDLDFVAEHARRRASQKFPLDAILHAYRCLHRSLSRWVRDAALETADETAQLRRVVAAVTDFTVEFTGALGTILTAEYVAHTRILAEAEGDRRTRLMDTLLSGYDESDRVAAQLLRRAGYLEQRQSYCGLTDRATATQ